ncbi:MAG: RNA polymerase sigma factor [Deltaproteobacteria bacterium]|nr:MAG: RNA polymerase sigma factor [Deltaproteobacteria bacterium]
MAEARDLMQRYCDGDAGAFRELYALVAPRLLGYLVKMTRDRALADDLLQQTFLKVHRARSAYVRGADPLPWIYSIAHRTFIDEARRHRRAVVRVGEVEELPEVPAGITGESADRRDEVRGDPELVSAALSTASRSPRPPRSPGRRSVR